MSAPSPLSVLPLQWEKRLPPKREYPSRTRDTPSASLRRKITTIFSYMQIFLHFAGKIEYLPKVNPPNATVGEKRKLIKEKI